MSTWASPWPPESGSTRPWPSIKKRWKSIPRYANAYNSLGLALAARGRPDKAMAQYRKALELYPGDPEAYRNLGKALDGRGRSDEAMALFRQAVADQARRCRRA